MYHVIVFTRISDSSTWISVHKSKEEALALVRAVEEGYDENLLTQEPIEVERINFV